MDAGDRERAAGDYGRRDSTAQDSAAQHSAAHDSAAHDSAAHDSAARDGDEAWAMLGYLGVPFVSILAPLAVYLTRARHSRFARQHATQALNLSITVLLYNLCVLILAGIMAADNVGAALLVAGPVALALWLAALYFLTRAAMSAGRGQFYALPRWICAAITR
jgi:uncharacterized Tic20 family protein